MMNTLDDIAASLQGYDPQSLSAASVSTDRKSVV